MLMIIAILLNFIKLHSFEIKGGEEYGCRGLLGYYKIKRVILCAPIFKPIFSLFSI
jgi:hypothetical protein